MKYTAIIDGEHVEIELHRRENNVIETDIGGRKYVLEAKAVQPGVYWLNFNNQSMEMAVTPSSDSYVVSLESRQIRVEILDPRTVLRRAAQHDHAGAVEIRAPMPGKIVRLLVAEGAEVEPNQGIVVMEAMKMQNEIQSPKKGIVRKLHVTESGVVNSGDVLATVE
jgi:biotin carboxyl carrier protein